MACLVHNGVTFIPTPFKLLNSSLLAEPLPDEIGTFDAAVPERLLPSLLNLSFLVCRHEINIENSR